MNPKERLLDRIKTIVHNEKRYVSFKDLLNFEHNGKTIKYTHGALRNLLSQLKREGQIYTVHRSPQAFYSIPGITFGNKMTPTCISVTPIFTNKQRIFEKFLKIDKLEYPSIHDIRLTFECKGLRTILLNNDCDLIDTIDEKYNKDITLKDITLDDITLSIKVHNTERISIMVSCSDNPIPINYLGIDKLSSALTRVEERIQSVIDQYFKSNPDGSTDEDIIKTIPYHMDWIVKMWHFGYDSKARYSGELFEHTLEDGLEVLFRIYSKKSYLTKIQ
ncbi:MAG: hypothetical protein AB7U98_15135 [Candidatus Nitrosocosmicus sp.]|jgi:hypothetical protein